MENESEWLVSDATCKGYKYYDYISRSGRGAMCCDYTGITGKIRHEKPKDCTVKELGKHENVDEIRNGNLFKRKGALPGGRC